MRITVWKIGIKWNRSKGGEPEILGTYLRFPIELVGVFDMRNLESLEVFVKHYKQSLQWWLNTYTPS